MEAAASGGEKKCFLALFIHQSVLYIYTFSCYVNVINDYSVVGPLSLRKLSC